MCNTVKWFLIQSVDERRFPLGHYNKIAGTTFGAAFNNKNFNKVFKKGEKGLHEKHKKEHYILRVYMEYTYIWPDFFIIFKLLVTMFFSGLIKLCVWQPIWQCQ